MLAEECEHSCIWVAEFIFVNSASNRGCRCLESQRRRCKIGSHAQFCSQGTREAGPCHCQTFVERGLGCRGVTATHQACEPLRGHAEQKQRLPLERRNIVAAA